MSIHRVPAGGQPHNPQQPTRLHEISRQLKQRVMQKSTTLAERGQVFCVSPTCMLAACFSFTWRRTVPRLAIPNLMFDAKCFEWAELPLQERLARGVYEGTLRFDARKLWVHRTSNLRCFDMVVEVLAEDPQLIRLTQAFLEHPSIRATRPEIPFTLVSFNPRWVATSA